MAGGLPTFNFQEGSFEGNEKITGTTMRDTILIKRDTCYACAVRCKRVVQVEDTERGITVDPIYGGPEYESLSALGNNCGVDDLIALAKANERMRRARPRQHLDRHGHRLGDGGVREGAPDARTTSASSSTSATPTA